MDHHDHVFWLRAVLDRAKSPVTTETIRRELPTCIWRCREFLKNSVPCGFGDIQSKMENTAIQIFVHGQGWRRDPELADQVSALFSEYVKAGYILVDGPSVADPKYWRPLEYAVVGNCPDTMVALIENGADESKIPDGGLIACIERNQTISMAADMRAQAVTALMRRRIAPVAAMEADGAGMVRRRMQV